MPYCTVAVGSTRGGRRFEGYFRWARILLGGGGGGDDDDDDDNDDDDVVFLVHG